MSTITATPRVGVLLRPQLPPERLRDLAVLAEQAGLDDIWLWEDCFAEGGLTTAAAVLAWTGSARIGLGLMPVPLRNPALAAMEIATLARLFPGRFVPAAGHGVLPWMDQVGAGVRSPLTLLREWVTATRSLLAGATVTVSGQYVRLDHVALEWPPATVPPLLADARGPKTLALAGQVADGLVLDAGYSPASLAAAIATAAAPRPQQVVAYLPCGTSPADLARIEAELAPSAEPLTGRAATGTPEQVARSIAAFAAAGATTVVLQPAGDDPDVAATIRLAGQARSLLREGAGQA